MFPIVFIIIIKGVVHLLEKGIINVSQRRTSPEILFPFLNLEMENPNLEWDPSPPPNYEFWKKDGFILKWDHHGTTTIARRGSTGRIGIAITGISMIFIGQNPGPRYLVARRGKKTTRWERRSKIFGSSQSVNCLVSNLQNLFHLCQFLEYPGTKTRTFPFNFFISS